MSNPKSGSKKYAVRNLRLCTKDCLCLYVCPTGATDTENSIIDVAKCIGCGDCADSCPSGAITMMPYELPEQQPKDDKVTDANRRLILSKAEAENLASQIPGLWERRLRDRQGLWLRICAVRRDLCCLRAEMPRNFSKK